MLLNLTNYKEVFEFTSGEYASWKSIIDIYQYLWITSQTLNIIFFFARKLILISSFSHLQMYGLLVQKSFTLQSDFNYVAIASFHLDNHCVVYNSQFGSWSSFSLIKYNAILYIINIANVDFLSVQSYSIHDIIRRDLFIFINFKYLISSSGTEKSIMSNVFFEIFISSLESTFFLAHFLIWGFLSLEPTDLPRFRVVKTHLQYKTVQ
jgi:hypothetical protein